MIFSPGAFLLIVSVHLLLSFDLAQDGVCGSISLPWSFGQTKKGRKFHAHSPLYGCHLCQSANLRCLMWDRHSHRCRCYVTAKIYCFVRQGV